MIYVKVPATSANMGPGFDTIGIALELYNHLWVEEIDSGFEIIIKRKTEIEIPTDRTNLIYKTMLDFYDIIGREMPSVRLTQEDYIPMVRGLGSSAACIVSGLLAANELAGNVYTLDELAQIGAKIEGHPDNSNPAFYGNLVVGAMAQEKMDYVIVDFPKNLCFAAMIPDFPVSTADARLVLPDNYTRKDMVFNASRTALLIASLYSGKLKNMGVAMEDKVHQPYREKLIANMSDIFLKAKEYGAASYYLSGAGSTLMAIVECDKMPVFNENMSAYLNTLPNNWDLMILNPDTNGAVITIK